MGSAISQSNKDYINKNWDELKCSPIGPLLQMIGIAPGDVNDTSNFEGTPPSDDHPSLKCHEIIADAVINSIGYSMKDKPKNLTVDDHIPVPGIELINNKNTITPEEKSKKRSII